MSEAFPAGGDAGRERLARAALVLLGVWMFREALFEGGILYWRDILLIWYPQIETFVRAVAGGSWPVWNPSLSFGQPLLADPGAQVLYPPTWLNLVMRPWHYFTAYAVGHLLLGTLGIFALAREWKVSVPGSLVAGAIFALSGPYLSFVDLWHHFAGASWLPVVIVTAERAFSEPRRAAVLAFGLAVAAQILAGSADMCALSLVVVGALFIARHAAYGRGSWAHNRPLFACAIGGGLLALGLGAGLWLPALDIVSRSARADLPDDVRTYWSVNPLVLLETVLPGLWTNTPLSPAMRTLLFESREPFLSSLYLGAPTVALVGAALAGPRHALKRFLAITAVVALLVALGRHAPAYGLVTFLVPPLRVFRYPVKVMVLVTLCWSLLAGIGFDAARRAIVDRGRWMRWVTLPLAVIFLADMALALAAYRAPDIWAARFLFLPEGLTAEATLRPSLMRLLVGGAFVAAALALSLVRIRMPQAGALVTLAMAALAVGDLGSYHRNPDPVAPLSIAQYRPEVLSVLRGDRPRLYVYDYTIGDRASRYDAGYELARQPAGWDPNAAGSLGMQMYLAPESIGRWGLLGSFEIDYRGLYSRALDATTRLIRQVEETPGHLRLLRVGGVTHVVAMHEAGLADLVPRAQFPGLFEKPIRVFEVPSPLPRAYAVGTWRVVPETAIQPAILAPDFDPSTEVVLTEGSPAAPTAPFTAEVRIVDDRTDRVRIEARLSVAGCVVLLDTYDPGWKATVDGHAAPVLRANGVFRAVKVGPGTHAIEFVYRPWPVLVGLSLSGATLLVVLGLWLSGRRTAAHPGAPPGLGESG